MNEVAIIVGFSILFVVWWIIKDEDV